MKANPKAAAKKSRNRKAIKDLPASQARKVKGGIALCDNESVTNRRKP